MNISITNLSLRVTENELRNLFTRFGKVKAVRLIIDKLSGYSCGFAFVEMDIEQDAKKAILSLNDTEMYGMPMSVVAARSPLQRNSQFAISHQPWNN